MTTHATTSASRGFLSFYREYARSGVHAAAAAGLTLFGLLATFWRGFVVLAILVYVLPPLYLYLHADRTSADRAANADEADSVSNTASGPKSASPSTPAAGAESEPKSEPDPGPRSGSEAATGNPRDERPTGTEPGATAGSDGAIDTETVDDGGTGTDPEWIVADSPTDEPLYDAVVAGDVFAVGDSGIVLARRDGEWEIAIERGPTVESNPLWGIDASDDGEHVWFGGDSGVLGQYEVAQGKLTDRSAPRDLTGTWEDVAVVGPADDEVISLVNGSGEVLRGHNDAGEMNWTEPVKPGSGSSLSGIEFRDREVGYCCDTSQGVFETADGGESWDRIGVDDAGVDFNDLAVTGEQVLVAGGDGSVFRYDDPGWTKLYAGEETIFAIDRTSEEGARNGASTDSRPGDADVGLAVGDNGAIYGLAGNDWEGVDSPTDETLCGVVVGSEMADPAPDVAVGDDGTVLERSR